MNAPLSPARLSPLVPRFERNITTSGVLFGLPCYGGQMHAACAHGLLETRSAFERLGLSFNIITLQNDSLIPRARNGIVSAFLESGCDRLFFIDADIGFSADQVLRILAHDRDVVAAMYRKKSVGNVAFAVNWLPSSDGTAARDNDTGAVEARHVATGFLCIKRRVVEQMRDAFPHLTYRDLQRDAGEAPKYGIGLFDLYTDPVTLEPLSEDYAFCNRWRALGGQVWADPGIILDHYGTVALTADPMEHLGGGIAKTEVEAWRAADAAA